MPHLSARSGRMPASPIRKLVPYAEAAKRRGTRVLHLNIGQPDLPTPPEFFEAIRRADIRTLEYSHSAGLASYRQALLPYYAGFGGHDLTPDSIIITAGGSEALRFAFMTCADPGDEVIIPEPLYANYLSFAQEAGVVVTPLPSTVESGFALPPVEAFAAAITPRTRAVVLCNPSNPTGKLYSPAELEQLAEIVLQHDLFLIADEVYREFIYEGTFTSALSLPGLEKHLVVVDSVSKRFSACGARIGALISRNAEFTAGALKLAQARLSPPTLGQIGAQALLSLPTSYYQGVVAEYKERRDTVLSGLAAIPGVLCPPVAGAFYVMPQLPIDHADTFCQWLLEEFSHNGTTVMLAPGSGFYASPGAGTQQVRLAYVLNTADLQQALQVLDVALAQYPGRTEVVLPLVAHTA